MKRGTDSRLTVRRIAVVFDALVPASLPDDVVAFRLCETAEGMAAVAGVEILPCDHDPMLEGVDGPRLRFWEREAARRAASSARRAAAPARRVALVVRMATPWPADPTVGTRSQAV